jgi:hypothetical protein
VVTLAFSVEPSLSESGTLVPSGLIPSATIWVAPASSSPSIMTTASSSPDRSHERSTSSAARVADTNVRDTADFDVERALASTRSPTGSPTPPDLRAETPASIRSSTTASSRSREANSR